VNKNNENTEIKTEGIKVNNEKKVIYFLLAFEPLIFISSLREFLTSIKIIIKKIISKITLTINKD
jgi:nucleoside permease NupC